LTYAIEPDRSAGYNRRRTRPCSAPSFTVPYVREAEYVEPVRWRGRGSAAIRARVVRMVRIGRKIRLVRKAPSRAATTVWATARGAAATIRTAAASSNDPGIHHSRPTVLKQIRPGTARPAARAARRPADVM